MRARYQNSLFRAIEEADLNIMAFSRDEEYGGYTISYDSSDKAFYFNIVVNAPPKNRVDIFNTNFAATVLKLKTPLFTVKMSPGGIASVLEQDYFEWDELLLAFREWLTWISEEISIPDLWTEAAKTAQLFAPTSTPTDDKFTRTELAEVQGQLRLLQLSFTQAALSEAAKQKLIELTQTAAVKAEGLSKKDWQNWIIGGFVSAIASLALNPTQAGEVLKLVKAAFGGLFLH